MAKGIVPREKALLLILMAPIHVIVTSVSSAGPVMLFLVKSNALKAVRLEIDVGIDPLRRRLVSSKDTNPIRFPTDAGSDPLKGGERELRIRVDTVPVALSQLTPCQVHRWVTLVHCQPTIPVLVLSFMAEAMSHMTAFSTVVESVKHIH
jgi:hypothetical protein